MIWFSLSGDDVLCWYEELGGAGVLIARNLPKENIVDPRYPFNVEIVSPYKSYPDDTICVLGYVQDIEDVFKWTRYGGIITLSSTDVILGTYDPCHSAFPFTFSVKTSDTLDT